MKIREDLSFILNNNNYKKLVFWGAQDSVINTKYLLKYLKAYKKVKIVKLVGGHMGLIENKEVVITQLSNFCCLSFK